MFLIDLIKSIYVNFRYLPLCQAIYLPIWITNNFKIRKLKRGQIILDVPNRKSIILGDGGSPALQEFHGGLFLDRGAKLICHGFTVISQGTVFRLDKDAKIELGDKFYCNKNCFFRSSDIIKFGDHCAVGWNVQINTNDGHEVYYDDKICVNHGNIFIGENVWLTSNTIVCKNTSIADGCILAQGAVLTKKITDKNSLIGGVPAKVIKKGVRWQN